MDFRFNELGNNITCSQKSQIFAFVNNDASSFIVNVKKVARFVIRECETFYSIDT